MLDNLIAELRSDIGVAMRARDRVATAALRSLLSEIQNAEAVSEDHAEDSIEVERRALSDSEVGAIVRRTVAELHSNALTFSLHGQEDSALLLKQQADALSRYLT